MSAHLSVQDVAELANVSTKTVRRAIAAGDLAAYRIGSRLRIEREAAVAWMHREPVVAAVPREYRPRERAGLRVVERGGFADLMAMHKEAKTG